MYQFRITFSSNVDEHYKGNGTDTTVSMVIDSDTFTGAQNIAEMVMDGLVNPYVRELFQVIAIQRVDNLGEIE